LLFRCFTPCFDLTNSGQQCKSNPTNHHQLISHDSSMMITR
jgi:hypothetical protein